jgi:GMP synthase-like glutamine amidotransferase
MPILVLQHSPIDTPGRLTPILRSHAHTLDVRRLDLSPTNLPADLDEVSAVISLGGPQSVHQNPPFLDAECALIRSAHVRQIPIVGICLGHQIIAHALGGEVAPGPAEFGFAPISILVPGQTDTVLAGIPWKPTVFHAHADHVTKLPPDATPLASSPACKFQAFRVGLRTYGFQFHFESTPADVELHLKDPWCQSVMAAALTSAQAIREQAQQHLDIAERVGKRLSENIASVMFPPRARLKV